MLWIISVFACMDPALKLSNLKQQVVAGQSITFPANPNQIMLIECQLTYYWIDLVTLRNITCLGEQWSQLPPPCIGIYSKALTIYFSRQGFWSLRTGVVCGPAHARPRSLGLGSLKIFSWIIFNLNLISLGLNTKGVFIQNLSEFLRILNVRNYEILRCK